MVDNPFEAVEPEIAYWRTRVEWELFDAVPLLGNLEPRAGMGATVRACLELYEHRCRGSEDRDRCWSKVLDELERLRREPSDLAALTLALRNCREVYENALTAAERYDLDTYTEYKPSLGSVHAVKPHAFLRWAHKHYYAIPTPLRELIGNPPNLEELKRENAELRETVNKLRAELEHAYVRFDPDSGSYPRELDIANQAWRAVNTANPTAEGTVRQRLRKWIEQTYPELKSEEMERIATVANWDKQPGKRSSNK